jgi:octaprenyl-diphosphate synthase
LIKAFEHASKKESANIRALMKKRKKTSKDVDKIVSFVHESDGMEYAKQSMYDYANEAIEALNKLPDSQAKQDFADLIHFVITRKK